MGGVVSVPAAMLAAGPRVGPRVGLGRARDEGGSEVVRGTPGIPRRHTVSTRLSEAEWAVWDGARAGSGRAEMGAWVRAVVDEVIGAFPVGGRPGDVPRVPEVNAAAYAVLTGAAANLNQLTRYAHHDRQLVEGIEEAIGAVVAAAFAVRGMPPPGSGKAGRGSEAG